MSSGRWCCSSWLREPGKKASRGLSACKGPSAFASAGTCAVLAIAATTLTLETAARGTLDLRGIDLPAWLLPLPIAVGAGLCMVEFLRFLVTRNSFYSARGTETIL